VAPQRLVAAGVNGRNEVRVVGQGGVAYRVDAFVLPDQPAGLNAALDFPPRQSRLP
jgi:hypothetical protein